jgi:hypothetical protein
MSGGYRGVANAIAGNCLSPTVACIIDAPLLGPESPHCSEPAFRSRPVTVLHIRFPACTFPGRAGQGQELAEWR